MVGPGGPWRGPQIGVQGDWLYLQGAPNPTQGLIHALSICVGEIVFRVRIGRE